MRGYVIKYECHQLFGVTGYKTMRKSIKRALRLRFYKKIRAMRKVINAYKKLLAHNTTRLPYGMSEQKLPYTKKTIEKAITNLYAAYKTRNPRKITSKTQKKLAEFESCYAALGSFMDESKIEFKGPLINPSYAELESFLLHIQKVSDSQKGYAAKLKQKTGK